MIHKMLYYCRICFTGYPHSESKFQCQNCFQIDDLIGIYNYNDACPICLDHENIICFYQKCNHWICKQCFNIIKIKNVCVICQTTGDTLLINKSSYKNNYFVNITARLKFYFTKTCSNITKIWNEYLSARHIYMFMIMKITNSIQTLKKMIF
jgi:hypothetical protein